MMEFKKNSFKKFIIFFVFCFYVIISSFVFISKAEYNSKIDFEGYYHYARRFLTDDKYAFYYLRNNGNDVLKNLEKNFNADCEKDEDFTLKLGQYAMKREQGFSGDEEVPRNWIRISVTNRKVSVMLFH